MKKLPIGIQNIQEVLTEGYVYVDKTASAYQLMSTGKHYFLSRPRRFGKSLFVSTLKEIFKGNKALFKDCAIYHSDYEWRPYPVVLIDLYEIDARDATAFEKSTKRYLQTAARMLGVDITTPTAAESLKSFILALHEKYQEHVVVLVDEYDKPILRNLRRRPIMEEIRELLEDFWGMLKSLDNYLRFTFTTGVSRFSKVSLFSGPNNLQDITMDPQYAAITGYTEDELLKAFDEHIQAVAQVRDMPEEEVLAEIKQWYNGYRFSKAPTLVYNPFSTLKYMQVREPQSYWYSTGTPSFLVKELQDYPTGDMPLEELKLSESELMDNSTIEEIGVKALMFQTGYLTIEDYDAFGRLYSLAFPNQEVREAFLGSLAKQFAPHVATLSQVCQQALQDLRLGPFFEAIQGTVSHFPYWLFSREKDEDPGEAESSSRERTYHMMLLSLLQGMCFSVAAEVVTNRGRIDLLLQTKGYTYVMEVKLDRSAQEALDQIHSRAYYQPYLRQGKQVVLLGINFSSQARNVTDWVGEVLDQVGVTTRYLGPGHADDQT